MGKGGKKKGIKQENETDKTEGTDKEKPLPKLVLKVGKEHKKFRELKGEVSDVSNHSTENDHGSHHKKKKKKHKHKQDDEKKSRKRELVAEINEQESPAKKLHLRIHKEKEKKVEPKEPALSPFRLCLENLHRNLQRKDVYNIFQMPVSDTVAPGYSKVIENPMDFLTMSKKIEMNEYVSIDQFKDNFILMCNNALLYNGPDTIYYKSADKMLSIGLKMMSKAKTKKMNKSLQIPVSDSEDDVVHMDDETSDVNIDLVNSSTEEIPPTKKKSEKKKKESKREQKSMTASILAAAHEARRKLLEKHPKQLYGYLAKDPEGKHFLNILNPDVTEETNSVPVTLEKLAPKLKEGIPAGQPIKEEKKTRVVPVNYLLYGPYGSFGPTYDSSLSNTTKEESDLLLQTYGTELGATYTKSIQNFSKDSIFAMDYVDRILNSITDGGHSQYLKAQQEKDDGSENKENKAQKEKRAKSIVEPNNDQNKQKEPASTEKKDSTNVDLDSLLTLDGLGIDMSFLKEMVVENRKEDAPKAHEETTKPWDGKDLLEENAKLLESLKDTQYKRLSNIHGGTAPVDDEEIKIATSITDNLKALIKSTDPKNTVSMEGIRKAIGMAVSDGVTNMETDNDDKVTTH